MRRASNNLAVLLLLCCLVGGVAFLCFSMGAVNLATMVDQKESTDPVKLTGARDSLAQNLKTQEDELYQLQERAEKTAKQIKDKQQQLAQLSNAGKKDNSAQNDIEELKKEIEAAEAKLKELEKQKAEHEAESNSFNPWKDSRGTERLKNPLFVECRKYNIAIHPRKTIVDATELAENNPFANIGANHDAIIFLIRPDGFETFGQASSWAEKMNLPVGYEPIDADWKLAFSRK